MKRVTKKMKRLKARSVFDETLYRLLRTYQRGEMPNLSVCVGQLDDKLTQVYDHTRKALEKYEASL